MAQLVPEMFKYLMGFCLHDKLKTLSDEDKDYR